MSNPYHIVARYLSRLSGLDRMLYAKRIHVADRNLLAAELLRNGVALDSVRFMLRMARYANG